VDGVTGCVVTVDGGTNGVGAVPGTVGVVGLLLCPSTKSRIVHFLTLPPGNVASIPSGVMLGSNFRKKFSSPSVSSSIYVSNTIVLVVSPGGNPIEDPLKILS